MRGVVPVPTTPNVLRVRLYSELAAAALMLMEVSWLSAFYTAFGMGLLTWGRVLLVMAVVMLGSHYLARVLNYVKISLRTRRIIFVAWLLLALLGSLKLLVVRDRPMGFFEMILHPFFAITSDEGPSLAEFWHLLIIALLAWRGVSLAHEPVRVESVVRSFQFGLLALVVYGFMIASFRPAQAYLITYTFLLCGFMSLAFARLSVVSELRGGRIGRFSRQWLLGIFISVVLVTALAVLAGIGIHRPITWMVNTLVLIFLGLVSLVTLIISYPILLLLNYLGPLLSDLFQNMPEITFFRDLQKLIGEFVAGRAEFLDVLIPPINAARLAGRIGVILAVMIAILLALRWRPVVMREPGEEDLADIRSGKNRLGLPPIDPRGLFGRFSSARRMLAAARIRRIYAELMDLAGKLGHARRQAATPLEFLPELSSIFPERGKDLESITHAYLKVRYGELPESIEAVEQVSQAWERVRTDGRRLWAKKRREELSRPKDSVS